MSNITTLVHDLKRDRKYSQDVVVAEHIKEDQNPRLSVIIYEAGTGNGLAVVTLEKTNAWGIADVKSLNSYLDVQWPHDLKAPPTDAGALQIIDTLIACAADSEQKKVA